MDRSLIQSQPAQWAAPEQRLPVRRGPHCAEIARPWQPVTAWDVLLRPSVTSSAQEAPAGVNSGGWWLTALLASGLQGQRLEWHTLAPVNSVTRIFYKTATEPFGIV